MVMAFGARAEQAEDMNGILVLYLSIFNTNDG
jgi:hypothetical protein